MPECFSGPSCSQAGPALTYALSHLSLVPVTQLLQFRNTFDSSANPFFPVFAWSKPRPSSPAPHGSPQSGHLPCTRWLGDPALGRLCPSFGSIHVSDLGVKYSCPTLALKLKVFTAMPLTFYMFLSLFFSFLSSPKTVSTYNITLVILSFFSFLLLDTSNSECPYVANPG